MAVGLRDDKWRVVVMKAEHTFHGETDWKKEIAKVPSAHFVCRL
jgi:hypothetical protein